MRRAKDEHFTVGFCRAEDLQRAASAAYTLVFVVGASFLTVEMFLDLGMTGTAYREHMTFTIVATAAFIAFAAILMGFLQVRLVFAQILQAEQLADRKDERLITAIESLTEELKRRPTPIETVNFSLFGTKK
jgi:cytochrome c biogenesis protein CcdA